MKVRTLFDQVKDHCKATLIVIYISRPLTNHLKSLLDISFDRRNTGKALAYLDGSDARLFKALRARLGSDEKVQNALILTGILHVLDKSLNRNEIGRIRNGFRKIVGMTYPEFEEFVDSIL